MFDSRVAVSASSTTVSTTTVVDGDHTKDELSPSNTDDNKGGDIVVKDDVANESSSSSSSRSSNVDAVAMMSEHEHQETDPSSPGGQVVGRCLDCDNPFDQFSGTVVCTVCRLPVLVCPSCRIQRCLPGTLTQTHSLSYFAYLHILDFPTITRSSNGCNIKLMF